MYKKMLLILVITVFCFMAAGCNAAKKQAEPSKPSRVVVEEGTTEAAPVTEAETVPVTEAETVPETEPVKYVTVIEKEVNIRKEPNVDSLWVGGLKPGEEALYISEENGWILIQNNDITGYVSADYVQVLTR